MARLEQEVIYVLPLRCRILDVVPLFAHHFESQKLGLRDNVSVGFIYKALLCKWPRNVRQALTAAASCVAIVQREGRCLTQHDLVDVVGASAWDDIRLPQEPSYLDPGHLRQLLDRHGTVTAAAKAAGISRRHFYRLLERHGLDK